MIKEPIVDFALVIEYELCVVSHEYLLNGKPFTYSSSKPHAFHSSSPPRKILKLNKNNKEVEISNLGSRVERSDPGTSRPGITVGRTALATQTGVASAAGTTCFTQL